MYEFDWTSLLDFHTLVAYLIVLFFVAKIYKYRQNPGSVSTWCVPCIRIERLKVHIMGWWENRYCFIFHIRLFFLIFRFAFKYSQNSESFLSKNISHLNWIIIFKDPASTFEYIQFFCGALLFYLKRKERDDIF